MLLQVMYVVPITSIFGGLALIPVGDTGTIPFPMLKESKDLATRSWAQATAVIGGTSTVLP
jgi:hypothetical protein